MISIQDISTNLTTANLDANIFVLVIYFRKLLFFFDGILFSVPLHYTEKLESIIMETFHTVYMHKRLNYTCYNVYNYCHNNSNFWGLLLIFRC